MVIWSLDEGWGQVQWYGTGWTGTRESPLLTLTGAN
jgi:hypothetical protein